MHFSLPFSKQAESVSTPTKQESRIIVNGYTVDTSALYGIPLLPRNCSFGVVRRAETKGIILDPIGLKELCRQQRLLHGADITVVYVVRAPGCDSCREKALILSRWASRTPSLRSAPQQRLVGLVGIVKDSGTSATDEALLVFYEEFYRFTMYKDMKSQLYKVLGSRKQPVWSNMLRCAERKQRKGSRNTGTVFKREARIFDGLLIFDKMGELRHIMAEAVGERFDTDGLDRVIAHIRRHDQTEGSTSFHVSSSEPDPSNLNR
jgi:hypothetical protein